MQFSELGLGSDLLRAIADVGYTQPTPIQEQAIPLILQKRDVLGCAQTGTGKTASFTLPMIEILAGGRARARMPRSLIMEPTRELAAQVAENFELYGKQHKLTMALLIGGESFSDQIKKLDRGVDVLIATPGRMIDLYERGNVLLSDIRVLVIDEADRMLDMGFIPDIERIVAMLPRTRQTLLFSATMPPEIRRLADNFLNNQAELSIKPSSSTTELVTQAMALVHREDKRKALRHLLRTEEVRNAMIFCNRKRDVEILQRSLERHGFSAGALHGDVPQSRRVEIMESFKNGTITLLVCSDIAARGLDIAGLSHVFNFDVPLSSEDYIHRIGRTGRAGRVGRAFTLACSDDGKIIAAITRMIQRDIPRIDIDGLETVEFSEGDAQVRRRGRQSKRPGGVGVDKKRNPERKAGPTSERASHQRASSSERSPPQRASSERPSPQRINPESNPLDRSMPSEHDSAFGGGHRQAANSGEKIRRYTSESHVAPPSPPSGGENWNRGPSRSRSPEYSGNMGRNPYRRRRDEDDYDEPVIGFGDHMPAFLMRPARPNRDRETSSEKDSTTSSS
ncbi:ATP-dependent RNA helicase RhlE [Azospirillaceae bacterium]